jgi:hypothetical protein
MVRALTLSEPVEARLPDGHRFVVRDVSLDEVGIRVRYAVYPTLPKPRPGERPAVQWNFVAVDDLGNVYDDGGGAYGPAADGTHTEGVMSLQPRPPEEAQTLTVKVSPWDDAELRTRPWLEFQVSLASP